MWTLQHNQYKNPNRCQANWPYILYTEGPVQLLVASDIAFIIHVVFFMDQHLY